MKGLLYKDFCELCRPFHLFAAAALLLAGSVLKQPYVLTFIAVYLSVLPPAYLQSDEISRWGIRQMTMPYARSTIVAEKYLVSLLLALISALCIGLGTVFCMQKAFPDARTAVTWVTGAVMPCIVIPALYYPFSFRFGAVKTNILMLLLLILFGGAFSAAISFPNAVYIPFYYPIIALIRLFPKLREHEAVIAAFNRILEADKIHIILCTLAGYAVLTLLSWLLARCGFRRRSF